MIEVEAADMRALTECDEAVRRQRVGVVVSLLRVGGGGRASSDTVISVVDKE